MERSERVATSVTKDTKRRVRVEAGRRDTAMAEILHEALHEWLEEHEGEDLEQGNSKRAPTATAD